MKRIALPLAALALCFPVTACTSGVQSQTSAPASSGAEDKTPVTITVSSFFTDKEKGIVDSVLDDFHASHPWITVKHTGGQTKDTQLQSLRGNASPDVMIYGDSPSVPAMCNSGQMIKLNDYMSRDGITTDQFVKATLNYTSWQDTICGFPMLSDVYALYYNKKQLKDAGIEPPKTWAEVTEAAKRLTVKNGDGSLKQVGFLPLLDYAEMNAPTMTPGFNLTWYTAEGKAAMASDPKWAKMLTWQKGLMDFYGPAQVKAFRTKLGDEFSTANPFYTGQISMMVDGEWRVAFIDREKPDLDYGVVALPNDDPAKYGGGYIAGTVVGVPKGSKHQEAAWQVTKYLATDDAALHKLATGLKNVPTTTSSLKDTELRKDPNFATLMDIAGNQNSLTLPATLSGTAANDTFTQKVGEWQYGTSTDPTSFLQAVAKQVDASLAQGGR